MMSDEMRRKLESDPDFIALKRYNYSLLQLEERYPDGSCPDHVIGAALGHDELWVQKRYAAIVKKLQRLMKVERAS